MSAGTTSWRGAELETRAGDSVRKTAPFNSRAVGGLLLYSVVVLAATAMIASRRHLWWDEIQTMLVATLPSMKAIWSALLGGADWQSPGVFLPLHYLYQFFGASELVGRLVGIVPYWLTTVVLYYTVARRTAPLYGFVAMIFPSITAAFDYSFEMRPYALVLLFTACTFLTWQLTKEYRLRRFALPALTISLGALVCIHYNACLVALPLLVGEAVIAARRRKVDYPVLIAMCCAALPLVALLPHIHAIRQYSAVYRMPHDLQSFVELYVGLFSRLILLLPLICAGFLVWRAFSKGERSKAGPDTFDTEGLRYWEIAAAATFLILPIVYFFFSMFTGALHYRHVLDTIIGASVLAGFLCYGWRRAAPQFAAIVLGLLCFNLLFQISHRLRKPDENGWGTYTRYADLFRAGTPLMTGQEPIVMGAGPYLLAYKYGTPDLARRSVYLMADPGWKQPAPDAIYNRNFYHAWNVMLPPGTIHAADYAPFVETHDRFMLYDPDPWLVKRLTQDGRHVRVETMLEDGPLYSVSNQ
jgi:hypothetical protein